MCTPGEKAQLWQKYLNSQLAALHANAVHCSDKTDCRYTRALAFFDDGVEDSAKKSHRLRASHRSATFNPPVLTFLCNHEVVLSLSIKDGSLRTSNGQQLANGNEQPEERSELKGRSVAFRLPFSRTHVIGRESKIDHQAAIHEIRMIILDTENAVPLASHDPKTTGDILQFFQDYLRFLREAGEHVLFGLPDFSGRRARGGAGVDYALLPDHVDPEKYCQDITYFGIAQMQINTYLTAQHVTVSSHESQSDDPLANSISRIHSEWLADQKDHFRISFAPPHIKPLCTRELVLYFELDNVQFFESANTTLKAQVSATYKWTMAFVVNVIKSDDGIGVVKVDFQDIRFARALSTPIRESSVSVTNHYEVIIAFLSIQYVNILTIYGYDIIYRVPDETPIAPIGDSGWWKRVDHVGEGVIRASDSIIRRERILKISLSDSDQVFSLSEETINRILQSRWMEVTWTQSSPVDTIKPLFIRLLSHNKAIVYVHIESSVHPGERVTVRPPVSTGPDIVWGDVDISDYTDSQSGFNKTTLAFEVSLQLVTEDKLDVKDEVKKKITAKFRQEFANPKSSIKQHIIVKHLVLDLWNSKPIAVMHNLGDEPAALGRLALMTESCHGRLKELAHDGYGILNTVPTLVDDHVNPLAFNDIAFKVLTKSVLTLDSPSSGEVRRSTDTPVVVIYGVCTERPLPIFNSPWSLGWLPSSEPGTLGTIWMSKDTFLHRRLLFALKGFNACTTVVILSTSKTSRSYALATLQERETLHGGQGIEQYKWKETPNSNPQYLEYTYEYDSEVIDAEGKPLREGSAILLCHTKHRLRIPISYQPAGKLNMEMTGTSYLSSSGPSDTGRTLASWQASIGISSAADAFLVDKSSSVKDLSALGTKQGLGITPEASNDHITKLTSRLDKFASRAVELLQTDLRNPWMYSSFGVQKFRLGNPMFTRRGDLVMEIFPYVLS